MGSFSPSSFPPEGQLLRPCLPTSGFAHQVSLASLKGWCHEAGGGGHVVAAPSEAEVVVVAVVILCCEDDVDDARESLDAWPLLLH